MKCLYITDPGIVGGATRSLVDVVSAMSDRGIECVVCTSSYNELNDKLNELGIENFASGHRAVMDTPAYKKWKKPLKKIIRGFEYHVTLPSIIKGIEKRIDINSLDLIHTNSARNEIGCILSKKYGIPHIMHIREFGKEDFECIYYRINYEKFICANTTRFIAVSEAVKDVWVRRGIERNKVSVIYNGVDNTKIIPRVDESIDNPLSMVIVGGVCEAKGQLQIVEAMGMLPDNIKKNVHLDIIGWGDPFYIKTIQDRAHELSIDDQVRYWGERKDVYNLLQNYHIGLTCSRAEGFGRVTAEYMHANLAVIASNAGANPELICDKKSGLLYQLDNYSDLADKICYCYKNREKMFRMAKAGRKYAEEHFTKEKNADQIYQLYCDIINK